MPVEASGMIFIRKDGSIEGTNKIYRNGNVYTFTGDIEDSYGIIVETTDIVINGEGHTLDGTQRILPVGSWDYGIELANITSGRVTVKNLKIIDFNIGIYVGTPYNTITGNTIIGSNVGILMAESPTTVIGNYIQDNIEGIFLGPLPHNHETAHNIIYHNSFVNNTRDVYDCECADPYWVQHQNIWDNGTCGNYWSNYNGTDINEDGIGDALYQITEDDFDVSPLISPLALPLENRFLTVETGLAVAAGIVVTAGVTLYVVLKRRKSKVEL
jgi:parallel beta-helix repeat protein